MRCDPHGGPVTKVKILSQGPFFLGLFPNFCMRCRHGHEAASLRASASWSWSFWDQSFASASWFSQSFGFASASRFWKTPKFQLRFSYHKKAKASTQASWYEKSKLRPSDLQLQYQEFSILCMFFYLFQRLFNIVDLYHNLYAVQLNQQCPLFDPHLDISMYIS